MPIAPRGRGRYGFSSTTTDKVQAQAYASYGGKSGDAMTIFEMQMGMVDRGANLTWLSQYPHEREVLLPPLTGIEALTSDVEGQMLVIHSRLSLNLSAQTLEQVLSRRRKMLMDMAKGCACPDLPPAASARPHRPSKLLADRHLFGRPPLPSHRHSLATCSRNLAGGRRIAIACDGDDGAAGSNSSCATL